MASLKKAYRTVLEDHFPQTMEVRLGDQKLAFRKRTWKLGDTDEKVEKGLRYGENPGQEAALYELVEGNLDLAGCTYISPGEGLVSGLDEDNLRHFGKHPGLINLADLDSALRILKYFDAPAAAVMKHLNPSGVALGETSFEALEKAYMADRLAAMGGCIVLNRPMDVQSAEFLAEKFVEVVAAPSYEVGVVEMLARQKSMRIIEMPRLERLKDYRDLRYLSFMSLQDGGIMVQQSFVNEIREPGDFLPATARYKKKEYRAVREPDKAEYMDLIFGWAVLQGVTSNSVVFVKDGVTVAVGGGEQDRVGVAQHAVGKAYTKYADLLCFNRYSMPYNLLRLEVDQGRRPPEILDVIMEEAAQAKGGLIGSRMVSDAFFPFRDGVDVGLREGITAVAHPGGSVRDHEVIEAVNEQDPPVAMVYTGQRCFRH